MSYLDTYNKFLASDELTADEKARLKELTDDEKKEAFAIPLAFGTAGMRGVLDVGTNRMNRFTVRRATEGLAKFIETLGDGAKKNGVVISYDTRRCSSEFAILSAKVLSAHGINVYLFEDVRPVPVCSFAIRHYGAAAGIMITASHNPKIYNGYKVYGPDGAQMSPEDTEIVVGFIDKLDYFGIKEDDVNISNESIKDKDNFKANDYITVVGKSLDDAYFGEIQKL